MPNSISSLVLLVLCLSFYGCDGEKSAAAQRKPLSPAGESFVSKATDEYNMKQVVAAGKLRLASHDRWDFDQTTGVFTLGYPDGSEMQADGQILGSYNPADRSWQWAWSNPNATPKVSADSLVVKAAGKKYGIDELEEPKLAAPDNEYVTRLCALGVKATDSMGVYKGDAGPIEIYIMLKNPRAVKKGD